MSLFLNSGLLGLGLAMDACAASMANGLNEPQMRKSKTLLIAFLFAFFQALMPLLGWLCVHAAAQQFESFERAIPYVALALLAFIGGKMIYEGVRHKEEETKPLTAATLVTQAFATSIDALSVGFTISAYGAAEAFVCAGIIATVTFTLCVASVFIGRKFGTKLGGKAEILGGAILILIGMEIFVSGVFFPAA